MMKRYVSAFIVLFLFQSMCFAGTGVDENLKGTRVSGTGSGGNSAVDSNGVVSHDLEMGNTPYSMDGGTGGLAFDPDNDDSNEVTIDSNGIIYSIATADPGIVFDTELAGDTDFWIGIQDDAGGDDDDILEIGDGSVIGTNPWVYLTTAGFVGIGTNAPGGVLNVQEADLADTALFERTTSTTNAPITALRAGAVSSGNAADEFGSYVSFSISDTGVTESLIGAMGAVRAGADNTGDLIFSTGNAGSLPERFRIGNDLRADLYSGSNSTLTLAENAIGKFAIGIATGATPTYNISFGGGTAKTIGMERSTNAASAGAGITISAAAPKSGETNQNGGSVTIASGTSTGNGESGIIFQTVAGGQGSGTTDRTASTSAQFQASGIVVTMAASQTIDSGDIIKANSCGSIKRITATGAVTTNTTNTFSAPASANSGCIMYVCNVGAQNITLDNNSNFKSAGAADVVMTADDCVSVGSTGASGAWYQLSALEAN